MGIHKIITGNPELRQGFMSFKVKEVIARWVVSVVNILMD